MLGRTRRRLLPPLILPDTTRLDGWQFSALVLALLLLASWLGARGLEQLSNQRRRAFATELRVGATAPVPYLQPVPATARLALGGASAPELTAVIRADSLPSDDERARLCALAAAILSESRYPASVHFIAFSSDVPPCITRPAIADARMAAAVKREIRSARWLLVDAAGRARYSRRTVPAPAEVLGTATLLRSTGSEMAAASGPSTPRPRS